MEKIQVIIPQPPWEIGDWEIKLYSLKPYIFRNIIKILAMVKQPSNIKISIFLADFIYQIQAINSNKNKYK